MERGLRASKDNASWTLDSLNAKKEYYAAVYWKKDNSSIIWKSLWHDTKLSEINKITLWPAECDPMQDVGEYDAGRRRYDPEHAHVDGEHPSE